VVLVLGVSENPNRSDLVIYEKPKKKIKDEKKKANESKDREKPSKKESGKEKQESGKKHGSESGALKRVFRRKAI